MADPSETSILRATSENNSNIRASSKSAQRLALRARIILVCAEGVTNQVVAARLGVAGATVGKWRERFRAQRLNGLSDEPRSGAPRTITDAKIEGVVRRTPIAAAQCDAVEHALYG